MFLSNQTGRPGRPQRKGALTAGRIVRRPVGCLPWNAITGQATAEETGDQTRWGGILAHSGGTFKNPDGRSLDSSERSEVAFVMS